MGVEHNAAVDPPLPCWVLRDVGQPELIRSAAVEVAADEILRGSDVDEALALLSGRNALEPPLSHQLVDELPGDDNLPAQPQLRRRRRPPPPAEVPGRCDVEDSAAALDLEALPGQGCNHRVFAFGRTSPAVNSADALLVISSSVSSSRIRRRAWASSDRSTLDRPGRSPRSIRSCARQRYTVASLTPISAATTATERPDRTSSTTRRRNSGAYDLAIPRSPFLRPDSHQPRLENGDQTGWTEFRVSVEERKARSLPSSIDLRLT